MIGTIGEPLPSVAAVLATMCAPYGSNDQKSVRYTYKDEEGEISRAFNSDNIQNRHSFVELLQGTEFCYQESDIQKFLAFKNQSAIFMEYI